MEEQRSVGTTYDSFPQNHIMINEDIMVIMDIAIRFNHIHLLPFDSTSEYFRQKAMNIYIKKYIHWVI